MMIVNGTFYQFSYKNYQYKYNVQISTFRTDLQQMVERSDVKTLEYIPKNLEDIINTYLTLVIL